jgi:hypothetical protein
MNIWKGSLVIGNWLIYLCSSFEFLLCSGFWIVLEAGLMIEIWGEWFFFFQICVNLKLIYLYMEKWVMIGIGAWQWIMVIFLNWQNIYWSAKSKHNMSWRSREKYKRTLIDKCFLRIKITVYWLLNSLSRFNDPAKLQGFRTQGGYIRHILPLLLDCCSIWFAEMRKEINCFWIWKLYFFVDCSA